MAPIIKAHGLTKGFPQRPAPECRICAAPFVAGVEVGPGLPTGVTD